MSPRSEFWRRLRTCQQRPRPGTKSRRFSSWTRGVTPPQWAIGPVAAAWSAPSTISTPRSSSWTSPTFTASERASSHSGPCVTPRLTRPRGSRPWTPPSGSTTCPASSEPLSAVLLLFRLIMTILFSHWNIETLIIEFVKFSILVSNFKVQYNFIRDSHRCHSFVPARNFFS